MAKFGVVVFPGSNCDEDMVLALRFVAPEAEGHQVIKLWHKDHDLQGVDVVVLPGGFSYGDYLRSGAIARFSPIMTEVINYAAKGGYVMGVCNGFQILAEAGLVPGALLHNTGRSFICRNVNVTATTTNSPFSAEAVPGQAYTIPIAHGEGRFFINADGLKSLQDNDQIIYQYCDANGQITDEANPNGSVFNIAGVSNKAGNVFGMMPHPERAASALLGNTDGLVVLKGLLMRVGV